MLYNKSNNYFKERFYVFLSIHPNLPGFTLFKKNLPSLFCIPKGSGGKVFNPRGSRELRPRSVPVFSGCHPMLSEADATNALPTEKAKGQSELLSGVPESLSRSLTTTKKEKAIEKLNLRFDFLSIKSSNLLILFPTWFQNKVLCFYTHCPQIQMISITWQVGCMNLDLLSEFFLGKNHNISESDEIMDTMRSNHFILLLSLSSQLTEYHHQIVTSYSSTQPFLLGCDWWSLG